MSDRAKEIGQLLGLIIHDLRNPAATISANTAFVKEVLPAGDEDLVESLSDVDQALSDLLRGMEQVVWIGRWLSDQPAAGAIEDGDVCAALKQLPQPAEGMALKLELPDQKMVARGGAMIAPLVQVMMANSVQHARRGEIVVSAKREGDEVVVTVRDAGPAIANELRESCFTLEGQQGLKGRPDGRYGRVLGLFASRIYAESFGARVEAGGEDGAAELRVRLNAI
jgi:signal transduction histidine kinase